MLLTRRLFQMAAPYNMTRTVFGCQIQWRIQYFGRGGAPRGNRKKVVFGGQCRCAEGATMRGPKGHAN